MNKISIEIDDRLHQVLLNSSAKSMRSFRKQIVFDLIETYKHELAKLPATVTKQIIEEKHNVAPDKTLHCKTCGNKVLASENIHKANHELCRACRN